MFACYVVFIDMESCMLVLLFSVICSHVWLYCCFEWYI